MAISEISDGLFRFGQWPLLWRYAIEKNNGGKWGKLDGSLDFVLVLYKLEAHKSAELELDWEKVYGILDNGTYRIIKQISYKNANDDYKTIDVAAEFVIK